MSKPPRASTPWHTHDTVRRLVSAILADEIAATRRRRLPEAEVQAWPTDLTMDEEGIGFDSLSRLEAATRLSEFFHLHEVGLEDRLLMDRTLGQWLTIVETSLSVKCERMTFRTSGSTGTPKRCPHETSRLLEEAEHFRTILEPGSRILSLVPPHHLFGFIFTVLLPAASRVPLLDVRASGLGLERLLRPGDIVAATPLHWSLIDRTTTKICDGVIAVSSTSPMPRDLAASLKSKGLSRLVEVYGSSETSGIGWRERGDAPYTLLPHWDAAPEGLIHRNARGEAAAAYVLADAITWHGPRHLEPRGRKDGAVKIGGLNVFPNLIAERIATHPDIAECLVRVAPGQGADRARLEAIVALRSREADTSAIEQRLVKFCADELTPAERPMSFTFVPELMRTGMGKLVSA